MIAETKILKTSNTSEILLQEALVLPGVNTAKQYTP